MSLQPIPCRLNDQAKILKFGRPSKFTVEVARAAGDENLHLLNESFLNQPFMHDIFLVALGAVDFVI